MVDPDINDQNLSGNSSGPQATGNGHVCDLSAAQNACVPGNTSSSSSSSSDRNSITNMGQFIEVCWRRRHLHSKIIFVTSVASLMILAYALVVVQWLLPYYFAVSAPLLIGIRIHLYMKCKWQYFLVDFCYFGNTCLYIYIWAAPHQPEFFSVMFALANGPLSWATCIFTNSLVFHDLDKMTSVYIHVLPLFVTYGIRWYPESLSLHWYSSFTSTFNDDPAYVFIWLVGVSFACFVFHTICYVILVYAVCRPDKNYLTSYRYLMSKDNWTSTMLRIFGSKYSFVVYVMFNWLYCILSLVMTVLFYYNFIAHSVYVVLIMFIVTWNGASYYVDVFSQRGFRSDA